MIAPDQSREKAERDISIWSCSSASTDQDFWRIEKVTFIILHLLASPSPTPHRISAIPRSNFRLIQRHHLHLTIRTHCSTDPEEDRSEETPYISRGKQTNTNVIASRCARITCSGYQGKQEPERKQQISRSATRLDDKLKTIASCHYHHFCIIRILLEPFARRKSTCFVSGISGSRPKLWFVWICLTLRA